MKLGHNTRAEMDLPEEEKPPIRKFKSWVIGLVIFITGNILNFVSFGEAANRSTVLRAVPKEGWRLAR
jgi:hypothetical protein